MSARPLNKRKKFFPYNTGVSDLRIQMLKCGISMREVCDRIMDEDDFKVSTSAISIALDENFVKYIHEKVDKMLKEASA
jgi:hypothetical protein